MNPLYLILAEQVQWPVQPMAEFCLYTIILELELQEFQESNSLVQIRHWLDSTILSL